MQIENYNIQELSDELILQLRNLVDGNQATAKDILPTKVEAEAFLVYLDVRWTFYASVKENLIAGGRASQQHFGFNKSHFEETCQELRRRAAYDVSLRQDFVDGLVALEGQGVVKSDESYIFHDFGSLSVHEKCRSCHGKGELKCGSCGGRGKKSCGDCSGTGRQSRQEAEYRNGQYAGNRTIYHSCYGCGGSGRKTCYNCSGRGMVRCDNCHGHGFFTLTRHIQAETKAKYWVASDTQYNKDALNQLLVNSGASFCAYKVPFTLSKHNADEEDSYTLSYQGRSIALKQEFRLHNKEYICCAFSNPPYPYVRPAIFDDLFADELSYLRANILEKGSIKKKKAIAFFNRFAGQPVLDEAMRNIVKIRTRTVENTTNAVTESCHGFITNEMAGHLAMYLNKLMDKISPTYSRFIWLLLGGLSLSLSVLLTEMHMEEHILSKPISSILSSGIATLIICLSACIVAFILSALYVFIARRNIPPEYRQKMRNKEPFSRLMKLSVIGFLFATSYGFAAAKSWLPLTHGAPLIMLQTQWEKQSANACHYLSNIQFFADYCSTRSHSVSKQNNQLVDAQHLANQTQKLTQYDKTLAMQNALVGKGYSLVVDGKFGEKSKQAADDYLQKQGVPKPNKATVDDYYELIMQAL